MSRLRAMGSASSLDRHCEIGGKGIEAISDFYGMVDLPEHCVVEFEPRPAHGVSNEEKTKAMREVYKILSESCDTGIRDLAARHNEHQP